MSTPLILVTNDDGVHAPGIEALAAALWRAGHDVVVVGPMHERSGSGAAVGHLAHGATIAVEAHRLPGCPDVLAYGVDGPPALCSLLGFFEVFGAKPDLVLSGINRGANTGRGLLQSGTVGAVLTAADLGISGAAVSLHMANDAEEPRWDTAAEVALASIDWLASLPRKTALNINVPDLPLADVRGVRWGRIAAFGPFTTTVVGDVPGDVTVQITPREIQLKPDTDTALVDAGYISVTALVTPRATEPIDVAGALEPLLARHAGRVE
jgi:5'-nucleotidase